MAGRPGRRDFGNLRKLPSRRWQGSYLGLDGIRHPAPTTFGTKLDAEAWLAAERRLMESDDWTPPRARRSMAEAATALTLATYAERWMLHRDLKVRTRDHYQRLLDRQILPKLGEVPLKRITSEMVRDWYADLGTATPTLRAHAYGLLRTILTTAVVDEKLSLNPIPFN